MWIIFKIKDMDKHQQVTWVTTHILVLIFLTYSSGLKKKKGSGEKNALGESLFSAKIRMGIQKN